MSSRSGAALLIRAQLAVRRGDHAAGRRLCHEAFAAGCFSASHDLGACLHGADGGPVDVHASASAYAACVTALAPFFASHLAVSSADRQAFFSSVHACKARPRRARGEPRRASSDAVLTPL